MLSIHPDVGEHRVGTNISVTAQVSGPKDEIISLIPTECIENPGVWLLHTINLSSGGTCQVLNETHDDAGDNACDDDDDNDDDEGGGGDNSVAVFDVVVIINVIIARE